MHLVSQKRIEGSVRNRFAWFAEQFVISYSSVMTVSTAVIAILLLCLCYMPNNLSAYEPFRARVAGQCSPTALLD